MFLLLTPVAAEGGGVSAVVLQLCRLQHSSKNGKERGAQLFFSFEKYDASQ